MAKTQAPTPSKNKLKDAGSFVISFNLTEAKTDDSAGADGKPKHEVVLTALQEGPGNAKDKRWYTREAVIGSEKVFLSRRKLFVDHLAEQAPAGSDSLKNWCATLKETWLDNLASGRVARKVRLKVHEEWLWTRCLEAPEEIALSIEGAGAGKETVIEGETYVAIEKIYHLNAVKFVTYPGNAKMGADLVESSAEPSEELPMDLKELTESMLRESRPDIIKSFVDAALAEAVKPYVDKLAAAEAQLKAATAGSADAGKITAQIAEMKQALSATIDDLRAKLTEADRKLDAYEVREKLRGKKELVERKLAASELPAEAKTPRFVERLLALSERKITKDGKEEIWTVESQVDAEIAEQKTLITGEFGVVRSSGAAGAGDNLTEEEQQVVFNHSVYRSGPSLEEFRAQKKAAAEAAKK